MEKRDKIHLTQQAEICFKIVLKEISDLENHISELPDQFDYLTSDQKNQLFHEFERLSQNLDALSSWLSRPISHRARFKISSKVKVLFSQEEGSITFKILETSEERS